MSERELLLKAEKAMQEMKYGDAVKIFDKLLAQDPSDAEAMYLKAQALSDWEDFPGAINLFQKALQFVRHKPKFAADILIGMGTALLEINRFDDAEKCFNYALRIKPSLAWVWVEKSRIAARRKNFQDSVECCDRAISIDSQEPRTWNNKAFALFQLGRLDDCIECAKKAISLKADYTLAWRWLGQAYESKGDSRQAEECFRKMKKYGQRGMFFRRHGYRPINANQHEK